MDALERPLPGDPDGRIRTLCYWRDTINEQATAGDFFLGDIPAIVRRARRLPAHDLNLDPDKQNRRRSPGTRHRNHRLDVRNPAPAPMLGRVLRADDERPGAPDVVVIGHDLWRAQVGADPISWAVLSESGARHSPLSADGRRISVPSSQQLWMPLRIADDGGGPRSGATLVVFGRLPTA